ncbi:MAG: response regulator [Hoeflea sp.]|uniref:response regulator n=1 Tax=Hoeflea sp. TaxID=1940281 RepID=UPI003EFA384D
MVLSETDTQQSWDEVRRIEALASALDIGILIYDRNDTLIAASTQVLRFFRVCPELLQPGARLRDLFNAAFDAGARVLGSLNGKERYISREDWIAERIAVHWRERYESVEKLGDGRWVRLCKRRMPDGILISTIQDVTDQKRKDEEMAGVLEKAELAQVVLDNLATPVVVKDSQLRYVLVNTAFCRIPGLPRKHILGKKAADFVGPELAAHFEKIERAVLETGIPYETPEDIFRADGTVMHVVTRVGRSGTPGNYNVTVSFDDVGALVAGEKALSDYRRAAKPAAAVVSNNAVAPAGLEPKGRILVLDEDSQRSADRVVALTTAGFESVATASANEALAFLDAAKAKDLTVHEVEISVHMAKVLSGEVKAVSHRILTQAIEKKLAGQATIRPVAGPAATPAPASESIVLSVVAPALQQEEIVACRSEPANPTVSAPAVKIIKEVPACNRVRVLVAEDNDVNQIVFEQILEGIGVDFRIVDNGHEAVSAWKAAAPDLILMDVSMPVMNGLQATRAIRDVEAAVVDETARVPIVAVTAHAMSGDRERCLAAGMDDYLSKPISPEKLEAVIRKWIGRPERFLASG